MQNDIDFNKIYSFSKIDLFDKCKQQYYLNYLDPEIAPKKKLIIKPRDYKTKGSAVHNAITLFYHLPKEKRNGKVFEKLLFDAWFSDTNPLKVPPLGEDGGFRDIDHERKTYGECLTLLNNFTKFNDFDPPIFYMPTKNIRYSFDDYKEMIKPLDKDIFISGKFDRVDIEDNGKLRIIDFKTGKNEKDASQLEFYKLLAEMNFEAKVDKVTFYYLVSKKVVNFDFSTFDSEKIKEKLLAKIKNIISAKEFPPSPNHLCSHCDFKVICPAFGNEKNRESVLSGEQIVAI